jgi:hypothetical protein
MRRSISFVPRWRLASLSNPRTWLVPKHASIHGLDKFVLDYLELSQIDTGRFNETGVLRRMDGSEILPQNSNGAHYDFIIFNFHPYTMRPAIEPKQVAKLQAKTFAVVLEIEPSNPYAFVDTECFDGLLVLDPTIQSDGKAWPFPRPLDGMPRRPSPRTGGTLTIGSFGLATPGKGFELLMSAVNLEFDEAIVRINIPESTYADEYTQQVHRRPYVEYLEELCHRIAKPGIDLEVTRDFMSETELLDWCADNDINCFMYTRRQSGLSATTDQAIIAGRPLLISANDTSPHPPLYSAVPPYHLARRARKLPAWRIRQAGGLESPRFWRDVSCHAARIRRVGGSEGSPGQAGLRRRRP